MKNEHFSIAKRIKSFKYAFNGLKILFSEEHNARVHLVATIIAIGFGFLFRISSTEWIAIILAIGLVILLEAINSAIENLADFVSPEKREIIKKVKDLSASAVFIGAIVAFTIGLIIFVPKLF